MTPITLPAPLTKGRQGYITEGRHSDDYLYEDTGCEAAEQCLSCPLPRCKYDDPSGMKRWRAIQEVITLIAAGKRTAAIALALGITERTVYRRRALAAREGMMLWQEKPSGWGGKS